MPILSLFNKPKQTGVTCEYCGWHGTKEDVFKATVMNEDSSKYIIDTCPNCMRNGGLKFYDDKE
jgi:hypothetical protein